ncbi:sigma 54-interacting transcriptional regulator [Sabulilitoribacter multivorans]|uniref:Sigma 54-interacting transcriptional regulator n=1 Tax=Flaviramulus multivorans TaxID=1304750 RepID=A0ABS9IGN3_9FLAO|nr:sigma 54-interacting transcriptional regulator [Flaviramulus multivorans]MCF7559922.1 sigma 54-interacting transcriptional regulator [Flaviramulus multivorans]
MKTILIVDDTYENLYLLKVILEQANYSVVEANDGKEGLEKLHKNKVDLIISDILMPVMDGYMFCQACKKDKSFKDIPFIFYTSTYTEKLDEDFALKLGAAHFLRKPTDPDEIVNLVQGLLSENKPGKQSKKQVKFTEKEVLKEYSERLINKLEEKNLDLENEVAERIKAQKALVSENEILDLIAKNTSLEKIFNHIVLNYESLHPEYMGSISILQKDGVHLDLISAPSMPKTYNHAIKRGVIGEQAGSCGTAAFLKKPVIVSDISKDKLWADYKDIALEHNLKSCWSVPIFSENKTVLGTFAIYSNSVKTPSKNDIQELNSAVKLAKIAIVKYNIMAEVKKREESYKSLVDQASDAIISYSLDGTIYDFNKAAASSLGYTENEFSKLKFQDFVVGHIIQNDQNKKLLSEGIAITYERQLKRKDSTLIEAEISAKLQNDGKVLGIVRDITEWKKNLNEIKQAKEFSTGLLKSMNEGLVVLNLNSEIVSVNPSFCEMTGFTEKELIGQKRPYSFLPPELKVENDRRYQLLKEGKPIKDFESVYIHKDGTRFPVQIFISSTYNEDGDKTADFATVLDITERRKAEIALKAAKEFSDKLIMSMQEGLLIVNLEGEIIMVNNSLCDMLGYAKEELIGLNLPYPFAKTEDLELMLAIKEDVAKGITKSFELEFFRKNGEKFIASFLSGNILGDNGEVIALFGTVKDITEEDKVKKALEEKAKTSNQKKEVILELANLVGKNFNESLTQITKLSAQTLNVERVGVWSFNSDKSEIFCEKQFNLKSNSHENGAIIKQSDNPNYFKALEKNQTIRIKDAQNNDITKMFAEDYLIPNNITSLMDVFINSTKGHYGVICFEHVDNTLREWTAEDQEFATSIANIVSLMIESSERKLAENKLVVTNEELKKANTELNILREQLEQENVYLKNELDLVFNYEDMVYGSVEFSNVLTEVEKVAPTNATVLLLGESGTGKELLARAIHNTSLRNNKPLIKVNCSAIPRELIESELFGHKKGAFTGAISDKIGKFELADGGTLFLDEIGELPLDMQPKILRFLQEGEIEVVGGTLLKKLDVRVIAATNRNLKEEIAKKQFREDLYFRLNVFPIEVPALRKRKDDIPLLVEHFVDKFNKAYDKNIKYIPDDTMNQLKAYEWPGNIRELENLIERAAILANTDTLVIPGFESKTQKTKLTISNNDLSLDAVQRNHIFQVLERCNWKISGPKGASALLDLKPSTLRDRMAKLGISKPVKQ